MHAQPCSGSYPTSYTLSCAGEQEGMPNVAAGSWSKHWFPCFCFYCTGTGWNPREIGYYKSNNQVYIANISENNRFKEFSENKIKRLFDMLLDHEMS